MPGIPVQIFEGSLSAKVTKQGAQVVAPFAYDLVVSKTLSTGGVAVNFYKPQVGLQFVVTGVMLTAAKNVTTDCIVDVYPGTSLTDATVPTDGSGIIHVEMLDSTTRDVLGLNVLVGEGKFVNALADDADVFVTIMGYYVPVVS